MPVAGFGPFRATAASSLLGASQSVADVSHTEAANKANDMDRNGIPLRAFFPCTGNMLGRYEIATTGVLRCTLLSQIMTELSTAVAVVNVS